MSKTLPPDASATAEIVDAAGEDVVDDASVPPDLLLGAPFAMVRDAELELRSEDSCPSCEQPSVSGATAVVRCDCSQLFRLNLLGSAATCPACGVAYTHVLLFCRADNAEVFADAVTHVMRVNGFEVPDDDDQDDHDHDDDDDQDQEDQGVKS